jgi:gluconolactonase
MPNRLATFATPVLLIVLQFVAATAIAQVPAKVKKGALPKTIGKIEILEPEFKGLLAARAAIEVLGGGFEWSEGPVWLPKKQSLLFSDIPNNRINRWRAGSGVDSFMQKSGYTGKAAFTGPEPGTNGLILDSQGRLVMCCHGDRAIKRVEKDGTLTVLVDNYQGKRLNSPNDLVYHSSGDLYFTDPPYGLPKRYADPARELDWCGVYRLRPTGELQLLTKVMTRPNGIGLSPDEKTLYVAQSDGREPIWRAFEVKANGELGKYRVFADASPWSGKLPGGCDGMAIDTDGRLWATGPGGVLVFTPAGKLIGRLNTGQRTANCTFGGPDGSTLFITADMFLCRVKTKVKGVGF